MPHRAPRRSPTDSLLLTAALLMSALVMLWAWNCTGPTPAPPATPTSIIVLPTVAPTPEPTLTTVVAGPPSLHATPTLRPMPSVPPSPSPTSSPLPVAILATATPDDILPVIVTLPSVTPMLRPPPAPAQLPRERS